MITIIECEGWRRHSCLIFLILLFSKPNIEVIGWLYQTKTHFTHIVYQPFSRVSPPSFTLYASAPQYKPLLTGHSSFSLSSISFIFILISLTLNSIVSGINSRYFLFLLELLKGEMIFKQLHNELDVIFKI